MNRILLLTLALVLMHICCYPQLCIKASHMHDYTSPDDTTNHTLKVEVTNNGKENIVVYLRNNPSVTDIIPPKYSLNPLTILNESGGTLNTDSDFCPPTPFFTWFKELKTGMSFNFYFQYCTDKIDEDGLLQLIRNCDAKGHEKAIEDLGWKEDEIIIRLPIK